MEAWLIEEIKKADGEEVELLLKALLQHYAALNPDWELGVFSIKKAMARNKQIDDMIRILQNMKE